MQTGSQAQFMGGAPGDRSGYLLYIRDGNLVARGFDPDRLELVGEPRLLAAGITVRPYGEAMYSASATGVLTYRTGPIPGSQMTWFDRTGKAAGGIGPTGDLSNPEISPDGKRIAFEFTEGSNRDVWTIEVATGKLSRLTFDPEVDHSAVWSPAGDRIAFETHRSPRGLYVADATRAGAESLVAPDADFLSDWTPDGRFLVFGSTRPLPEADGIWLLPLEGERKARRWSNSDGTERGAVSSPDGKWIAYVSNESGQNNVYVRPFNGGSAAGAGKWQISTAGGSQPAWRSDGKELFYLSKDNVLMAAAVRSGATLNYDRPVALFDPHLGLLRGRRDYATRDGKRFLVAVPIQATPAPPLHVVVNWPAALNH